MTSEELFQQAHAKAAAEVADLELALWFAVHGDDVIAPMPEATSFVNRMREAQRLARIMCEQKAAWVEKMAMDDALDRLREALA